MGLFNSKKASFSFSEIINGLQHAVSSSAGMLQTQQIDFISRFWSQDGKPLTQKVKIGDRDLDVPLMTLVNHSNLAMDSIEIKFKAQIADVVSDSKSNQLSSESPVSMADLQMSMSGIRSTDDDVMDITVTFKIKETPEGVSRILDEYNKTI